MYKLTLAAHLTIAIPLPGRTVYLSKDEPDAFVSDEEFKSGPVEGRVKMGHVRSTFVLGDLDVPESEESIKVKARRESIQRARLRAKGIA